MPVKTEHQGMETIEWKIWILSTRLEDLDLQAEDEGHLQAEDEGLLQAAARPFDDLDLETEVFIIGGGNA